MFLVGAVYFVAGSYPVEEEEAAETEGGSGYRTVLSAGRTSRPQTGPGSAGISGPGSDSHIDNVLNTLEQAVVSRNVVGEVRNASESGDEFGESLCLLPGDSDGASMRTEVTGFTVNA